MFGGGGARAAAGGGGENNLLLSFFSRPSDLRSAAMIPDTTFDGNPNIFSEETRTSCCVGEGEGVLFGEGGMACALAAAGRAPGGHVVGAGAALPV